MKQSQLNIILSIVLIQIAILKSRAFILFKFLFFRGRLKHILKRLFFAKKYYNRKIRIIPCIIPKYTGRLGNQLSEFSFCLLLAHRYNMPIIIPPKMRVLGLAGKKSYHHPLIKYVNKCNITKIINGSELTLKYPHNILFHQNNLTLLRKILFPDGLPRLCLEYDVVIHLRLGDIRAEKNSSYKIIPCQYIIECLEMIFKKTQNNLNILFVSEIKTSIENKFFQENYHAKISILPYINNIAVQSKTMEDDFKTLMQFKYVIMSVSSFSYWSSLLSANAIEIHLPLFTFTKLEIAAEYWESTPNKKIILHKI
jgi:hypothetical protein